MVVYPSTDGDSAGPEVCLHLAGESPAVFDSDEVEAAVQIRAHQPFAVRHVTAAEAEEIRTCTIPEESPARCSALFAAASARTK